MINITMARPEHISQTWEEIKPFIEKALVYTLGEYNIDDVKYKLEAGIIRALLVHDKDELMSVLTLEILEMPQKKVMNVMTCGGACMEGWLEHASEVVDQLAKELKVDIISIYGRSGWQRTLRQYDYKPTYTVLTKEIT